VGRISAHIDRIHNEFHGEKTAFFGFFESIEDAARYERDERWARFGWQLIGFTQHADHVASEIEEVKTGEKRTFRSAFLVGCDGARSTVRRALGIRYEGEGGEDRTYMMGRMQSTYIEAPGILAAQAMASSRSAASKSSWEPMVIQ
jgi:flavin-dependent dehydrogenase